MLLVPNVAVMCFVCMQGNCSQPVPSGAVLGLSPEELEEVPLQSALPGQCVLVMMSPIVDNLYGAVSYLWLEGIYIRVKRPAADDLLFLFDDLATHALVSWRGFGAFGDDASAWLYMKSVTMQVRGGASWKVALL